MAATKIEEAIKELYYWQYGTNPTNFTSRLFDLMTKADIQNRCLLAIAFPFESKALELWHAAKSEEVFFKEWGMPL